MLRRTNTNNKNGKEGKKNPFHSNTLTVSKYRRRNTIAKKEEGCSHSVRCGGNLKEAESPRFALIGRAGKKG